MGAVSGGPCILKSPRIHESSPGYGREHTFDSVKDLGVSVAIPDLVVLQYL